MQLDTTQIETGNARLLYKEVFGELDLLQLHIQEIEKMIIESAELDLANEWVYLYFFSSPKKSDLLDQGFWIGREIIGMPNEDQLSSDLEVFDSDAGEALRIELDAWEMNLEKWRDAYQHGIQELEKLGVKKANVWRIGFGDFIDEKGMSRKAVLDLFFAESF